MQDDVRDVRVPEFQIREREKTRKLNFVSAVRGVMMTSALVVALGVAGNAAFAQSAEDQEKQYNRETMEQALQTRERYNLYGLRFASDQAALDPAAAPLLDDIATTLKNFPEWGLRIVGHTDSTGTPEGNAALSLQRAEAIKAALTERGIDASRLSDGGRRAGPAGCHQ